MAVLAAGGHQGGVELVLVLKPGPQPLHQHSTIGLVNGGLPLDCSHAVLAGDGVPVDQVGGQGNQVLLGPGVTTAGSFEPGRR